MLVRNQNNKRTEELGIRQKCVSHKPFICIFLNLACRLISNQEHCNYSRAKVPNLSLTMFLFSISTDDHGH